jgi:SlyX protein
MPESQDTAGRLTELETRLAFQESALQDLGEVLRNQQQQIDALSRQLEALGQQIEQLSETLETALPDERPPHY